MYRNLLAAAVATLVIALSLSGCLESSGTAEFNISGDNVSVVTGRVTVQTASISSVSTDEEKAIGERIFKAVDENGDTINVLDFRINQDGSFQFLPRPVYDLNHYLLFNIIEEVENQYLDTPARYLLSPQAGMNFVTAMENKFSASIPLIWVNRTAQFGAKDGFGFKFASHEVVFQEWDSDLWISYNLAEPTSASTISLSGNITRDKNRWLRNLSTIPYTIENADLQLENDDKVFYLRLRNTKKWVAFQITDVVKTQVLRLVLHYTDPQSSNTLGFAGSENK